MRTVARLGRLQRRSATLRVQLGVAGFRCQTRPVEVVLGVFGALMFLSWVTTVGFFVLAARHKRTGVPWSRLVFSGMASLNPDNYTDEGRRHLTRVHRGMGFFFLFGFLTLALAIAHGAMSSNG